MNTNIHQSAIESLDLSVEPTLPRLVNSINLRIQKHLEHIERDRQLVVENLTFINIVNDAHERIKDRLAKIEEVKEILTLITVNKGC